MTYTLKGKKKAYQNSPSIVQPTRPTKFLTQKTDRDVPTIVIYNQLAHVQ